jgi:hypothetical protein
VSKYKQGMPLIRTFEKIQKKHASEIIIICFFGKENKAVIHEEDCIISSQPACNISEP